MRPKTSMWKRFLSRKLPYLVGDRRAAGAHLVAQHARSGRPTTGATARRECWPSFAREYDLSQDSLGDIDPTSETIRLTTLGLRNVAANVLWYKANEYKKREDWYNLMATVDTITKLQPHFISVWTVPGLEPVVQRVGRVG